MTQLTQRKVDMPVMDIGAYWKFLASQNDIAARIGGDIVVFVTTREGGSWFVTKPDTSPEQRSSSTEEWFNDRVSVRAQPVGDRGEHKVLTVDLVSALASAGFTEATFSDDVVRHDWSKAAIEAHIRVTSDQERLVGIILERMSGLKLGAALQTGVTVEDVAERMLASLPAINELDQAVGPFYDTTGLVKWLGLTKQGVASRVKARTTLGLRSSDNHWMYPAFQFSAKGEELPRLKEVLDAIDPGDSDPWSTAIWLNQPMKKLDGRTPAEALRTGLADTVVATANGIRAAMAS